MSEPSEYLEAILRRPTTNSKVKNNPSQSNIENNPNSDKEPDKKQPNEVHYLLDTNIIYDILEQNYKLDILKLNSTDTELVIHILTDMLDEFMGTLLKKKYDSDKEQEDKQFEKDSIMVTLIEFNPEILGGHKIKNFYDESYDQNSTNGGRPKLRDDLRSYIINNISPLQLKLAILGFFKEIGTVYFDISHDKSPETVWAKDFQDKTIKNRKYYNKKDEPLSEVDCRLLKFYLHKTLWHLYTGDQPLIDAANDEGKKIFKKSDTVHSLEDTNSTSDSVEQKL